MPAFWTRFPLGRVRQGAWYVNICDNTRGCPLREKLQYYPHTEPALKNPETFVEQRARLLGQLKKKTLEIGVGWFQPDLGVSIPPIVTPELVENGAVWLISCEALRWFKEPTPEEELSYYAVVFPLHWYAWMMRTTMTLARPQLFDFRLMIFYGAIPAWRAQQRVLAQADTKQAELITQIWRTRPVPCNKFYLIHKGQRLDYRSYCLTCERKAEWSVGSCAFGRYNCVLGTDLVPELLSAPLPRLEAIFAETPFRQKEDCVERYAFEPYSVGCVRATLREEFRQTRAEHRQSAIESGARIRIRNVQCRSCIIGRDSTPYCKRVAESCAGPFSETDIPVALPDPWILHVFALSKTEVDTCDLERWFSGHARSKCPDYIVRPLLALDAQTRKEKWMKTVRYSPDIQYSDQWVWLVRSKYPHRGYMITYAELCEMRGCAQMDSEAEVVKVFPQVRKWSMRVRLAINLELLNFVGRWLSTFYTIKDDSMTRHYTGPHNRYTWRLTSSDEFYAYCKRNLIPRERRAQNAALKRVIVEPTKKKFTRLDTQRFFERCRQIGTNQALQEYLE
jgi:hypothetical protein